MKWMTATSCRDSNRCAAAGVPYLSLPKEINQGDVTLATTVPGGASR